MDLQPDAPVNSIPPKYELLSEDTVHPLSRRVNARGASVSYDEIAHITLYRIRALVDIPAQGVKAGDLGGYVQSEKNLSHEGSCWIADNAHAFENSRVMEDALIGGRAAISGNSVVAGRASVGADTWLAGDVRVDGHAVMMNDSRGYYSWGHVTDDVRLDVFTYVHTGYRVRGGSFEGVQDVNSKNMRPVAPLPEVVPEKGFVQSLLSSIFKLPAWRAVSKNSEADSKLEKKYELIADGSVTLDDGTPLYRVRALRDFGDVRAGDLGGYVQSGHNLSQEGDCWIGEQARAIGFSRVVQSALVTDEAELSGHASARGNSVVSNSARMSGHAIIDDHARLQDSAEMRDLARLKGASVAAGKVRLSEETHVGGNSQIGAEVQISGKTEVFHVTASDNAVISGAAKVSNATVLHYAKITDDTEVRYATLRDLSQVVGNSRVGGGIVLEKNSIVRDQNIGVVPRRGRNRAGGFYNFEPVEASRAEALTVR